MRPASGQPSGSFDPTNSRTPIRRPNDGLEYRARLGGRSAAARRLRRAHGCRGRERWAVTDGLEAIDRPDDVLLGAVLAELRLRLDPGDVDLQPDDRPELALDVGRGSVVDRPRLGASGLMAVDECAHVPFAPGGVIVDDELAMEVDGDVVPRWDDAAVLPLRRVPRRRDVGVRAADDHHRLADRRGRPLAV